MERLAFTDFIDIDLLQMMQDSLSRLTGLNMCIADTTGRRITKSSGGAEFCWKYTLSSEKGRKHCDECYTRCAHIAFSERKAAFCTCFAGMTEFAVPIFIDGAIVGTIVAGQVREGEPDEENLTVIAEELGIDPNTYINAAREMACFPEAHATATAKFLSDFSSALSTLASANYKKRKELEKSEHTARSQTEFITDLSGNLRESMESWMDSLSMVSEKFYNVPEIKQEADTLLLKASEVYAQIGGAVDYIRMAGGSTEYAECIYNIRELIERTAAALRDSADSKGVCVITSFDDALPEKLAGNAGRIGQIIGKISTSLINFTNPGGSVEISVSCERTVYSCGLIININGEKTRMTEKAAHAIGSILRGAGVDIFAGENRLTAKDTDFRLIVLLLRQMSGTIEAPSLSNGNVSFRMLIPQLDGSRKSV